MSNNPVISFVMPAYKPQFLKQAIDSIVMQSFQDWELIIVDDCSPYNLNKIVSAYTDTRIRYYKNSQNIGGNNLVMQWNHSIQYATGQWIVLAADDDVYVSDFCLQVNKLTQAHPLVNLIRTRVVIIDEDGNPGWRDRTFPEFIDKYEYLDNWIDNKAFICVGNFAFRRTALMDIGGFIDFPCAFNSDIATPIALSANGVANSEDILFQFRNSNIHLSAHGTHPLERIAAVTQFYEWLSKLDYITRSQKFLHKKCVYDYFNQVIRYSPFSQLFKYLKLCTKASAMEKAVMAARWFKQKYQHFITIAPYRKNNS